MQMILGVAPGTQAMNKLLDIRRYTLQTEKGWWSLGGLRELEPRQRLPGTESGNRQWAECGVWALDQSEVKRGANI